MPAEMTFSWKDLISLFGLILSVAIWIRTLLRDKSEPRRNELRSLFDKLETEVEEVTAEMIRHLLCQEARLDNTELQRRMNRVERWVNKLSERLSESQFKQLSLPYIDWSRTLTTDPFPITNKKNRLKKGDGGILLREDKAKKLDQIIDTLRQQI
jgi:hypothetical protein